MTGLENPPAAGARQRTLRPSRGNVSSSPVSRQTPSRSDPRYWVQSSAPEAQARSKASPIVIYPSNGRNPDRYRELFMNGPGAASSNEDEGGRLNGDHSRHAAVLQPGPCGI